MSWSSCAPQAFPILPTKDPADVLNYALDFSDQMQLDGDSIASITSITATPPGLTITNPLPLGNLVTFLATGGTTGYQYTIVALVQTAASRTYSRSATLMVAPR